MNKRKLGVLFGGVTVEHEVSVITGQQLMNHANPDLYEIIPVYVDKQGQWWTGDVLRDPEYFKTANLLAPHGLQPLLLDPNRQSAHPFEVAILCFHGGYGEAGNVQGLLELAGIPYQGPGVVGSATAFDKIITRHVLGSAGFRQAEYTWFTMHEFHQNEDQVLAKISELGLPVYLKPANGGSTVGIEKVSSEVDLSAAIARVGLFDQRILVEKEITDCIEINVSVLGIEGDIKASVPEQPIKSADFLSYADKYERGGKKSGMASATRRIPAPISASLTEKVQAEAINIFRLFDCSGVIRIDFFVDPSEETIFVIEPNTIPGSMSFYLWEASGISYPHLIDRLVEIADQKAARQANLTTSFESNILAKKQT